MKKEDKERIKKRVIVGTALGVLCAGGCYYYYRSKQLENEDND